MQEAQHVVDFIAAGADYSLILFILYHAKRDVVKRFSEICLHFFVCFSKIFLFSEKSRKVSLGDSKMFLTIRNSRSILKVSADIVTEKGGRA